MTYPSETDYYPVYGWVWVTAPWILYGVRAAARLGASMDLVYYVW